MQQKNIQIGNVEVPIIIDGGEEWFPVSYLCEKVLLRKGKIKFNTKYTNTYIINYEFCAGGIQEVKCVSKDGIEELLTKTQIGRLSVKQRMYQNELHEYLGLELLATDEQDTKRYNIKWLSEVDAYTKDVINTELKLDSVEWIRRCSKCNNHYPMTNRFYAIDNRSNKGFAKICRVCTGKEKFTHQDHDKNRLAKQQLDLYKAINEDSIMSIYESYRKERINRLPDCYQNKESYLRIIKGLHEKGELNESNLTLKHLIDVCKLKKVGVYCSLEEIYGLLYGEDFYLYAWKYPKFQFRNIKLTDDIAITIVNNYIKENEIAIKDIFIYDYEKLFSKCGLKKYTNGETLGFTVKLYKYKYAGYLFKTHSANYYKDESNLLFDLKYLIENDMKIEISKIPLYLTKNVLHNKSNSLYRFIVTKKNGSLYEWINKLYPGHFIETDFEVNAYREEFGSDTECYVHEILKENFKNVIYNQIHTSRTIEINGMIPDWLIIADNGVWIVEYFGLYEERQYGKTSRVTEYIDKTKMKIERYREMEGYKFIFLYPEDVEDDYKGCREIIAKMKENPYFSMV